MSIKLYFMKMLIFVSKQSVGHILCVHFFSVVFTLSICVCICACVYRARLLFSYFFTHIYLAHYEVNNLNNVISRETEKHVNFIMMFRFWSNFRENDIILNTGLLPAVSCAPHSSEI